MAIGQVIISFVSKTMGKNFRTDDHELLEEAYELIIKTGFTVPTYPAGISSLLQDLEKQFPKAQGAKPEGVADSHPVRELDQSSFIKTVLSTR